MHIFKGGVMLAVALAAALIANAGNPVYTKQISDKKLEKKAAKWAESGKWRDGFTMGSPDPTVNLAEFYTQYKKNTAQWQAMFRWLASHDLLTIEGGKHKIEGTNLTVSVEDSENDDLERRESESHRQHIDFQYVVSGAERFGIIDHETSQPNCQWRPDVIHYDYDAARAKFVVSDPAHFFLFFPDDWHIAKIKHDGPDQSLRVIVVKLDYVE